MNNKIEKIVGFTLTFLVFVTTMFVMAPGITTAANEPPVAIAYPKYQEVEVGKEAYFSGDASYDNDGWIVDFRFPYAPLSINTLIFGKSPWLISGSIILKVAPSIPITMTFCLGSFSFIFFTPCWQITI